MKVLWTLEAEQDRIKIWEYIAADNPSAVARMDQLFSEAFAKLTDFPTLGHAGLILGTRELMPHESYRLVYEVDNDNSTVGAGAGTQSTPVATAERMKCPDDVAYSDFAVS